MTSDGLMFRGIALAMLAIAGCSDVIDPDETPPLCGDPRPIWAISQHSMTYLSCFDHQYAWDAPGARHRGHSSDTSVVTVTNKIPDTGSAPYEDNILVLTGHKPGTAVITIEATAGGGIKRHIHPVTVRLALDTEITRCDAEPIPGVEGATQLAMDAWGKSNANLKNLNVTGVAGRDTVMHVFMERMGAFTRAEWSVKAVGGPMPQEPVQCSLAFEFETHGHGVPQTEGLSNLCPWLEGAVWSWPIPGSRHRRANKRFVGAGLHLDPGRSIP